MQDKKKEPKYYSEADRQNSQLVKKHLAKCKKNPMSYEDALKQQERNSK